MKMSFPVLGLILSPTLLAHVDTNLEAIEVFDHSEKQTLVDFIPSVTTLRGRELQKRRQISIGDTLQNEAGVNSTNFGPSSSRPVIRGLDGDRIRVLQNSLGTLDASTQSLDHAIPVDTLTIEQMEIVRGPMSLLYGSSAVGGVVNLVTNRIHTNYEEGFFSQAMVQGETANPGVSSALHLNYGAKKWMYHIDGSTRNLADQRLPSHVSGGADEKKGKIPNSANQQDNVAAGVSHIMDRGHLGVSFNHFNTVYGTVADEEVDINMTQSRTEMHGEWRPEGNRLKKIKLRSAQSDYFHKELEGGETGTVFRNRGNETRLEGVTRSENVEGVVGVQSQVYQFSAAGEEAFLPETDNLKLALFSFHELSLDEKNAVSFGARLEHTGIRKKSSEKFEGSDYQTFAGLNGSLGYLYKLNGENSLSTSLSYTERAPNFQELYAGGEHLATATFEQGDSGLKEEKAYALEVNFKNKTDKSQVSASVYGQVFKDYIALNPTGEVEPVSGLDVYQFEQVDALFYGFDLDARRELKQHQGGVFNGFGKFDWVRAKNTDSGSNLPRISPTRLTLGVEYTKEKWTADLEAQYVAHQTKTARFENGTDAYTLTNLGYTYNIVRDDKAFSFFARVRNIFDVEARNHVSFIKDIAPLAGRNFIVGAQIQM